METRTCDSCKESKKLIKFRGWQNKTKKGRRSTCRKCEIEKRRINNRCGYCNRKTLPNCGKTKCKICRDRANELNKERRRTVTGMLRSSLDRAKRSLGRTRKIECDLSLDQLQKLYTQQCGKCAVTKMRMTSDVGDPLCLSVDRIDSDIGYILSNIMIVCRWVNLARGAYPLEEFKKRILEPFKTSD